MSARDKWQLQDSTGQPLLNTALVEAMKTVSVHDTPEARGPLFRLLLDSTLVAITPALPDAPGASTSEAGDTVNLVTLEGPDGIALPLFTSSDRVFEWTQQTVGVVAMPARALFQMAADSGMARLLLDPGSTTSGFLTRHEIEALAQGRLPIGGNEVLAETHEVRIGDPATPPPAEALNALRAQMRLDPRVVRGSFFLMQEGARPPQMMIAIELRDDVSAEDEGPLMRAVIDGAAAHSELVQTLSFVVADERWKAQLAGGAGVEFYAT